MHGAMHSAQASILVDIAFGAPRRYDALNPIYPFFVARGGNLAGGLDLAETAEQLNRGGAYPASEVGEDNTSAPRNWRRRIFHSGDGSGPDSNVCRGSGPTARRYHPV